jgi:hypothetical protein
MLIRNPVCLLLFLLLLIQMKANQLHAGKYRKAIIALSTTSTSNQNWYPSQIFDLRSQGLPMVEDIGDFIELMKAPSLFNDSKYIYRDKFQSLYEEFFNDNVARMFIDNKATIADMRDLEEVLIFWPSALELRSKFLEANRPRDLKTALLIIKGTSGSIREAGRLDNFFSVVIQRNTKLVVALLLDATNKEWRQFSRLFENAWSDERLNFFRALLKKATNSQQVFRVIEYSHDNYGANYTDLLISEIFTGHKKIVSQWQFAYEDYLKLLNYTHFHSTDLKIKILACNTVRTLHQYDELRDAGFQNASDEEIEKWQKSFSEACHLSAEAFINTVDEIKSITEDENQAILDAMPVEKKWFGKNCDLCNEIHMTFRIRPCQCVDKTNFCDKCIKNIVYNNLIPTCSLCRTPLDGKAK